MDKKRFTIGLQINTLSSDFANLILMAARKATAKEDVNLIVFPGQNLNNPYGYDYQCNVIYSYLEKCGLDALIMTSGTLCNYISDQEFHDFIEGLRGIPIVSIGIKIDGLPSIVIDNKIGMRQSVTHLISAHGRRRIAFIKGPENNPEAQTRYEGYCEALNQFDIPYDPELVVPGDFTYYTGAEAVSVLLKKRKVSFDALVAANDEMALSAKESLADYGIDVPSDISLTSFDDIEAACFSSPSLTTVAQPFQGQVFEAVNIAIAQIQGKPVPLVVTLPTELVIRSSCGCLTSDRNKRRDSKEESGLVSVGSLNAESIIKSVFAKHSRESGSDNEGLVFQLNLLIDSIDKYLKDPTYLTDVRRTFNQILDLAAKKGMLVYWGERLDQLLSECSAALNENGIPDFLHEWFQQARALVVESQFREQGRQKLNCKRDISVLRDVMGRLLSILDTEELAAVLERELIALGIKGGSIISYGQEIKNLKNSRWKIPEKAEIIMAFNEHGRIIMEQDEKKLDLHKRLIPEKLLPVNRRYELVLSSLFFREDQYGVMFYELADRDGVFYETLWIQIGSIMRSALLFAAKQKAEDELRRILIELESYNIKLREISQTDELTGLYNRRGFLDLATQQFYIAQKLKKKGLIFFFDLDKLKMINDNYGHNEGDFALSQAADVLKKSFRNVDIIARFGGDEFAAITHDTDESFIDVLKERFDRQLEICNKKTNKPYSISISMGVVPFCETTEMSLEDLMRQADELLYAQKKCRKSVISPCSEMDVE